LVHKVARRWAGGSSWAGVTAAFAAAAQPAVPQAIERLRAAGARRIALGSWFLAPGLLPDRVIAEARSAAPDVTIAQPLGADIDVAELVLHRYSAAITGTIGAQSA
jgi:sirohydrochlorin ferrochelatase